MTAIIFWTLVFLAGAWALHAGVTTATQTTPDADADAAAPGEPRLDDRRAA